MEVTRLTCEVERLCKEKADLLGELEAHRLRVSRVVFNYNHIEIWRKVLPLLDRV